MAQKLGGILRMAVPDLELAKQENNVAGKWILKVYMAGDFPGNYPYRTLRGTRLILLMWKHGNMRIVMTTKHR
jgi:predicted SAM-dependent methyltransferase